MNEELAMEIQGAEQDDEMMFAQMSPKGNFTSKALNNLVKATNRLLPLFGQTPDYPMFEGNLTEFPTEFVRVLTMFKGAVDSAVQNDLLDDELSFDMAEVQSDEMVNMLAGKINQLVNERDFKRYLKETTAEEEVEEEEVEEVEPDGEMVEEDIDSLFMERM